MAQLLVNGQPISLESGQKTWADALGAVETRADSRREAVTAVRFDGVDQPTFASPAFGATSLDAIGRIDVETVSRARLLRATLGTAGHSLPALASGACQAAASFRRGAAAEGHEHLNVLLTTLHTLTHLTLASAAAAGVDLTRLACGADSAAEVLGAVGVVLDALALCQRNQDWVALADGLEYDLAPALLQWGVVFDALHEGCAA